VIGESEDETGVCSTRSAKYLFVTNCNLKNNIFKDEKKVRGFGFLFKIKEKAIWINGFCQINLAES
jgi:hypothetical protein